MLTPSQPGTSGKNECLVMVDESNKSAMHRQSGPNTLYYFELNQWHATNAFRNLSVKFVLEGIIYYKIGSRLYPLKENQILVANKQPDVLSHFESSQAVKSVCLNFDSDLIASAYAMHAGSKAMDPDDQVNKASSVPEFHERLFSAQQHDFLQPLHTLARQLQRNPKKQCRLNEEFFLGISENIILQIFNTGNIGDLNGVRFATRKEILRRLEIALAYLHSNFLERPTVARLGRICNMSEYHFFRAFRQAYKVTPYQYQLKLRLERAAGLIRNSDFSLVQVAEECAFPDLPTFSKAFKRFYHIAPSDARRSKPPVN